MTLCSNVSFLEDRFWTDVIDWTTLENGYQTTRSFFVLKNQDFVAFKVIIADLQKVHEQQITNIY